ncbi:MAG: transporter substrate-binding domain-containing protein, partial [Pseudomonadota bacterium]
EADAALADSSFLATFAEEDGLLLLERSEILGGGVGLGVRESDGELKEKLNAAIQSMKDDGSLNELIVKWEVAEPF